MSRENCIRTRSSTGTSVSSGVGAEKMTSAGGPVSRRSVVTATGWGVDGRSICSICSASISISSSTPPTTPVTCSQRLVSTRAMTSSSKSRPLGSLPTIQTAALLDCSTKSNGLTPGASGTSPKRFRPRNRPVTVTVWSRNPAGASAIDRMVASSGSSAPRVSSAINSRSSPVAGHGLPNSSSESRAMPCSSTRGSFGCSRPMSQYVPSISSSSTCPGTGGATLSARMRRSPSVTNTAWKSPSAIACTTTGCRWKKLG